MGEHNNGHATNNATPLLEQNYDDWAAGRQVLLQARQLFAVGEVPCLHDPSTLLRST